jgi:hypothetical protein
MVALGLCDSVAVHDLVPVLEDELQIVDCRPVSDLKVS